MNIPSHSEAGGKGNEMRAIIVKSYGTFVVGLTEYTTEDLLAIADKGYEVLARSNGVQIARCNTFNEASQICQELGANVDLEDSGELKDKITRRNRQLRNMRHS